VIYVVSFWRSLNDHSDAPDRGNRIRGLTLLVKARAAPFSVASCRAAELTFLSFWFQRLGERMCRAGSVKWFSVNKGYGFIAPDGGGSDVFVHIKAVQRAGFSGLVEGVKVDFDIVDNRGKQAAENLRVK
jgi:CspA family cold shock protein